MKREFFQNVLKTVPESVASSPRDKEGIATF